MTLTRPCEACGAPMTAPRANKRFCSDGCRADTHAGRALSAAVRALPPAPADESIVAAVRAELTGAGRHTSAVGRSALHLAGLIESNTVPPAALAALNKELRATLAEALQISTTSAVATIRDELAARRARA